MVKFSIYLNRLVFVMVTGQFGQSILTIVSAVIVGNRDGVAG